MDKEKFLLEIDVVTGNQYMPVHTLKQYFSSLKVLRQWRERNENRYLILDERKYIRDEKEGYEPFVVFGKSIVKYTDLSNAKKWLELKEEEKDPTKKTVSNGIKKTWK